MANLQNYSLAYVTVNGSLLTEHASMDITRSTGSQAVMTVAKGYAGESPGASTVEIDITNAVPSADFEFNPGPFMKALQPVEIGIIVASKTLVAKGFIISDAIKHSVNSESTLSFKFRGQFADFE